MIYLKVSEDDHTHVFFILTYRKVEVVFAHELSIPVKQCFIG